MTSPRRGASAIVIAISAGVMFAFVGLVVDFGIARLVQSQLQAATDVAAVAGARRLDGSAAGVAAARATAVDVAAANYALNDPVQVDPNADNDPDGDVVLGVNAVVGPARTIGGQLRRLGWNPGPSPGAARRGRSEPGSRPETEG